MKKSTTQQKILFGFLFAFACVGIFFWITYNNVKQTLSESKEITVSLKILHTVENIFDEMQDLETGERGYVITGNDDFLWPYKNALEKTQNNLETLLQAAEGDAERTADAILLNSLVREKTDFSRNAVNTRKSRGLQAAAKVIQSGKSKELMDQIRPLVLQIEERERAVLNADNLAKGERAEKTLSRFIFLTVIVFIFLLISFIMIKRDFKRRKKWETKINYFATLFSNVHDAIFSTDTNFVIKTWNKGAEEIYGWKASEAIGKTVDGLLLTDYGDVPVEKLVAEFRKNGFFNSEVKQKNKVGETLYILVSSSAVMDEIGRQTGAVSVNKDITKKKELENQLKQFNEELENQVLEKTTELKNILERIDDAFIALDRNWHYTYVNKKAGELYGKKPEDVLGKSIWFEFPDLVGGVFYKTLHDAMEKQVPVQLQHYHAGTNRLFKNFVYPSPEGVSVYYHDITEKKKTEDKLAASEIRFRAIFETEPECIKLLDLEMRVLDMNPAGLALIEAESADQILGKNVMQIVNEEYRDSFLKLIRGTFEGKSGMLEFTITGLKGTNRWMETHAVPLRNEAGEIISSLSITRDITQRKKTEVILRESEDRFRTLYEENPLMNFTLDANGKILSLNKRGATELGYSIDELIGKSVLGVFHKEDHPIVLDQINECISNPKKSFSWELRKVTKSGQTILVAETGTALVDNNGGCIVMIVCENITDRKKSEEELRRSSSLLQATLESTNDGILVVDRNGKFSGYNRQFVTMWNIPDEILNEHDDKKAIESVIEQLKNPSFFVERVQELYNHPEEISFDVIEMKDGRTIERYSQPQRMNDEIVGRVWSFRDVTKRKEAEEETKKIADQLSEVSSSVPGAVYQFQMSQEGKMSFAYVSEGIYELSGLKKEELYKDAMLVFSVVEEEYMPGMFQSIEISAATLQPWFYIFKIKDLHGKNKWIRGNSIPGKLPTGDIVWNGTLIDITDLKTSEEKLKTSELHYRSLIEQASDYILLTDETGNIIDVNSSLCNRFGYTREELLKSNASKLINPEQVKKDPIRFDLLLSGQSLIRERQMILRDGTIIEVEVSVKMLPDGRLLTVGRDMTERKKTEVKLQESESSLKEAQRLAHIGSWDLDLIHNKLTWSDEVYRIFEYDIHEFNLSLESFIDHIHPDDRAKVSEAYSKSIREKTDYDIVHRIITKTGRIKYVNERCETYYDDSNNPVRSIGTVQDITEQKKTEDEVRQSEQKYKFLFNKNPLPMWMLSMPDLKFIDVNESAINHYGYTREEFMTMTSKVIRPPEDLELFLQHMKKRKEVTSQAGIWRHMKKDGTVIHVDIIAHDIRYEGKPARLILANDVTEKMLSEEKLKQSHEQLRQLSSHLENIREEERTNIAREIHDELGQQLTGLKMDASWLNKKISSEDQGAHDKIAGMISLIDETVKTVRRISSELRPGILDDLGLIDALEWQSTEFEKRTGIRCKFKSESADMQFDKKLSTGIFRVYQETLTNVARHAQASEIKTSFELKGDFVILKVKDNGKGFDESEIKNKNSLGLVGMKERATMFGSKLTILSSKGAGTSILLEVPLKVSTGKTDPEK